MGLKVSSRGGILLPWQGSVRSLDPEEFLRGLNALVRDGRGAVEYRALPSGRAVVVDPSQPDEAVLRAVRSLPQDGQIYHGINPPRRDLQGSAKVADIVQRSWLLIDVDPRRPKDVGSTAEEKAAALAVMDELVKEVADWNWPNPVLVDSGNGFHAYYRIHLPNDAESRRLAGLCLKAMAKQFDSPLAGVDVKVCDAPRIAKAPGTWARKGPDSPARPWRLCRVLSVPADPFGERVSREQLEQLARQAGPEAQPAPQQAAASRGLHVPAGGRPDPRAQALRYVENAAGRVRMSRSMDEGGEGRNNALNSAVFYCSRFIGILSESEVAGPLRAAAESVGCPGIEATIRSAMERGRGNPKGLWMPGDEPKAGSNSQQAAGKDGAASLPQEPGERWQVCLDDVVIAEDEPGAVLAGIEAPDAEPSGGRVRLFDMRTLGCLLKTEYPPPRWVVNGIMSEGLNLLIGSPKQGKSLMALNLALTIAGGGKALESVPVEKAGVLYLSLEDQHRRVKDRALKMLARIPPDVASEASARLTVATSWPRQSEGGLRLIDLWLSRMDKAGISPGLVIIDVWNRFAPVQKAAGSAYRQDADDVSQVKQWCDARRIAALVVHHTRKSPAGMRDEEDFVASISGTQGIAGSADGIMVLVRSRNESEAELKVTGRDVEEKPLALQFIADSLTWRSLGSPGDRAQGKVQEATVKALRDRGGPAFLTDLVAITGQKEDSVRTAIPSLMEKKLIRQVGNAFCWPGEGG
jgi:hypothetical protein